MKNFVLISIFLSIFTHAFGNDELKKQLNYAISTCQQDMQQFSSSGLTVPQYLKFCECYMTNMINALDKKEIKYQAKYKKPSGKYIKTGKKIKKRCVNKYK